MSGLQRLGTYVRTHPVAMFLVGGVALQIARSIQVTNTYNQHFKKYDVQRRKELEEILAAHHHKD